MHYGVDGDDDDDDDGNNDYYFMQCVVHFWALLDISSVCDLILKCIFKRFLHFVCRGSEGQIERSRSILTRFVINIENLCGSRNFKLVKRVRTIGDLTRDGNRHK